MMGPRARVKRYLQTGAAWVNYATGLSRLTSNTANAVLMYHSVGGPDFLCHDISPGRLATDIEFITDRFELVDLPAVVEDSSSKKKVAITFDDGYENFYTDVLPLLRKYEVPATVFVVPRFVGDDNRSMLLDRLDLSGVTDPRLEERLLMDADQIRALVEEDLVTIGNHTLSHPDLRRIETRDRLREEIAGSRERLERQFGIEVQRFCYPYGHYDDAVVDVVRDSHELAVTTDCRLVHDTPDPHRVPRKAPVSSPAALRWNLWDVSDADLFR